MKESNERARRARLLDDLFVRQCIVKNEELALQHDDPDRERLAEICRQLTKIQDVLGYLPLDRPLSECGYETILTCPARLASVILFGAQEAIM